MIDKQAAELCSRALEACQNAYVPYSHFPVGACLLTKQGDFITGCNIENVSYGLTNCAERTALFKAVSDGVKKEDILAFAVASPSEHLITPCGACRQVMAELLAPETPVLLFNGKTSRQTTVQELLPLAFDDPVLHTGR